MSALHIAIVGNAASVNVRNWADALRGAGAQVEIVSFHAPPAADAHVHVVELPRALRKLRYFAGVPAVRRALARLKPDIVVGYFATGYGTTAALSGWTPLVLVAAGSDIFVAPKRNRLIGLMLRLNFRRAGLIVAFAPHMTDALRGFGVPDAKIMTMPRGIALDRFGARGTTPRDGQLLSIVSTRSLLPVYNIDALLDALPLLGMPYRLTIAGDGPLRDELERRSDAAHVHFAGHVPQDDMPRLLADHTVFVSLSQTEGVSASLLEAMAAGLTPVVADIEANRQWIKDGDNGVLVRGLAPETVADALRRAHTDLALRRRAYERNPQIVHDRADQTRSAAAYLARFERLAGR